MMKSKRSEIINFFLFCLSSVVLITAIAYAYPWLLSVNNSFLLTFVIVFMCAFAVGIGLERIYTFFKFPFPKWIQAIAMIFSLLFWYLQWCFTLDLSPQHVAQVLGEIWEYSNTHGYIDNVAHQSARTKTTGMTLKILELLEALIFIFSISLCLISTNTRNKEK